MTARRTFFEFRRSDLFKGARAMSPTFGLLLMLACAVFFYKAAEIEKMSPLLWCASSILLWLCAAFGLGWGIVGCLLVQGGLFAGITCWRLAADARKRRQA